MDYTPAMAPWRSVLLVLVMGVMLACGPSFQVVYEGDSRFEHCYALDENPNVLMQQKSDCWADWMKHYTYGQTRDRLEFAAMRHRAITRADTVPTDEAIMGAAPGEGTSGAILAAPAPTNAFAPPPMIASTDAGAPVTPSVPPPPSVSTPSSSPQLPPPPARPPGTNCVDACSDKWQACHGSCTQNACAACDKSYMKCAKVCFRSTLPP
jgi:hypothetical protein